MKTSINGRIILFTILWTLFSQSCFCARYVTLIKNSKRIGITKKDQRTADSRGLHSFKLQFFNSQPVVVSERYSDLVVSVSGKYVPEEFIIISPPFAPPLTSLRSTLQYVSTYLVFKPKYQQPNDFTGHVAYIRKHDAKDWSIEWGYIDNVIVNGSFASAFLIDNTQAAQGNIVQNKVNGRQNVLVNNNNNNKLRFKAFSHSAIYPEGNQTQSKAIGRSFGRELEISTTTTTPAPKSNHRHGHRKRHRSRKHKNKRLHRHDVYYRNKRSAEPQGAGDKIIFEGFGSCERVKVEINITTFYIVDTRISYYMNILRVNCDPKFAENVKSMIEKGFVREDADFRYVMNKTHPIYENSILDPPAWSSLISTIFLEVFSNTYNDQMENVKLKIHDNESPTNKKISRTARIMTIMVFKVLYLMGTNFYDHTIKITNTMIEVLAVIIKSISKSKPDLRENDQLQLAGLIGFLQNDLIETLTVGEDEIFDLFNEHYIKNLNYIKASLTSLVPKTK